MSNTINEPNLIKILRTTAGITQKDLANRLGVTQQEISKLERSDANISTSMLAKVCNQLNLCPLLILNNDDFTPILDTNLITSFKNLKNFPSDKQTLLFELIHLLS